MLLPMLWCAGAWAQQYTISTIAGTGQTPGFADGGATNTALFNSPSGMAYGPGGKLYVADPLNHRIRMISGGNVTTVAGDGTAGFSGDGAAATSAELDFPSSVAVDSAGNLYIADTGNHVIRKVDTKGNISTIAGSSGQIGSTGDNGPATSALLNRPGGVAVDSAGNIYIADTGNSEVRKVAGGNMFCTIGCGATQGVVVSPQAVAVDASGTLYVADTADYRVISFSGITTTVLAGTGLSGFSGDGGPATNAQLNNPQAITIDSSGYLYIADSFNGRIRKVLKDGTIITIAGTGAIAFSGDGGPAASAALYFPRGIAVDGSGNVYVSDTGNSAIRQLTPTLPLVNTGGVVSAASSTAKLAPGMLASLYGGYLATLTASGTAPLPRSLGGVSVTVNGVAAPILYVSPTQINFQVPWSTQTGTATVSVNFGGGVSNTISVPVQSAAPGLFVSGGNAVAQNYPNYSLNTSANPIPQGGILIAYLTGIGSVAPSIADGILTPSTTVYNATSTCSATIGGQSATVMFSGLTPNFVGLAQANIQVPSGVTGPSQLSITCNGQTSNTATIYVK
jgi:uncharacterized protein (TIGR03437 family)